jgi:hypothetical protein
MVSPGVGGPVAAGRLDYGDSRLPDNVDAFRSSRTEIIHVDVVLRFAALG